MPSPKNYHQMRPICQVEWSIEGESQRMQKEAVLSFKKEARSFRSSSMFILLGLQKQLFMITTWKGSEQHCSIRFLDAKTTKPTKKLSRISILFLTIKLNKNSHRTIIKPILVCLCCTLSL